ncbi:MAG: hypothetical protein MZV65_16220 [Chromatiales bacterium]|nr:hypothetical protein [Chromatiales bacterium]
MGATSMRLAGFADEAADYCGGPDPGHRGPGLEVDRGAQPGRGERPRPSGPGLRVLPGGPGEGRDRSLLPGLEHSQLGQERGRGLRRLPDDRLPGGGPDGGPGDPAGADHELRRAGRRRRAIPCPTRRSVSASSGSGSSARSSPSGA